MNIATVKQRMAEGSLVRAVMESIVDGLIIIDEKGVINSFNTAAEKMFGYRPDEVIGENIKTLMPESYRANHGDYLANYLRTGEAKVIGIGREVAGRRKDGTTFPIELGVSELWVGRRRSFVGTVRDITDRKEREASEVFLRNLLDTIADGLMTMDASGTMLSVNPAAHKLFGYAENEMLGCNVNRLIYQPARSKHDTAADADRDAAKVNLLGLNGHNVRARRKDGSSFLMELSVSEMEIRGERIFSGIIRDVTGRKKAEEEAALLAAIVKSSDDAIVSKALDGTITSWNSAAEKLFGYTTAEALGQPIDFLVPPGLLLEEQQFMDKIKRGKAVQHFETVRRTRDGRLIDVSLTVSSILNAAGEVVGVSKIAHDISARKATEAQLQITMDAVERSNQELDDFAYIASHDLKEPLRGLANNAMFLEEDYEGRIDATGVKRLHRMIFLCHRMERLVDDLLYFSRLGRQELAVRGTDLNIVINEIRELIEATDPDRNVTISVPELLPTIACDVTRVTEVFRNLIANAIKYNSSEAKLIEIGSLTRPVEFGPPEQVFFVRDNGIGIPRDFQKDIFRIFKRLNEEDESIKGTGVGLTFVKKIVERHCGRIWVESRVGEGSTFYFTLNTFAEAKHS